MTFHNVRKKTDLRLPRRDISRERIDKTPNYPTTTRGEVLCPGSQSRGASEKRVMGTLQRAASIRSERHF